MSQSPSLNPNRQFGFLQSSSTPLFLQNASPNSHRFKSTSLKQINHSKLRNQSSPYYTNHHSDRQTFNPANVIFNYQHCDDSESDVASTDTSISSFTRTNPPTTPISSLIPTSTESSPSIATRTEQLLHVTPATNSLESSRPISSDNTTYSRSSSYTSLSSFEFKSTHSSAHSDYSNQLTSECYSDLPNSPAEAHLLQNQFINRVHNYSIDSNPSKSNDITLVEKTVLAANCSKNEHLEPLDEDEQCVAYEMEGSISGRSVRSNVSQLTFPNEPTADLTFIRNLLETKKMSYQPTEKPQWSMYTPPVKLETSSKILVETQVSKTLFPDFRNDFFGVQTPDDTDKDSIKYYNDEEDRESCTSKASVPSLIRNDMEGSLINRVHLNKLYEKLNSTKDSSLLEKTQVNEPEEEEDDQKILFEFIDECFKNNKAANDDEDNERDDKLPKIEEEENENETSFTERVKVNHKKSVPIVQMTRTAMLRANMQKSMPAKPKTTSRPEEKKVVKSGVCQQTMLNQKPTFKFMGSSQTNGVLKKPTQVLTSINNNWHSK